MQIVACVQAALISVVLLVCNHYASERSLLNAAELFAILFFFAGMFLTMAFSGFAHMVGLAIIMGSAFTLKTFAWIVLFLYTENRKRSPAFVFGIGIIVFEGLPLLFRDVIFVLVDFIGEDASFSVDSQAIIVATLFLLTIATVLLLGVDARAKAGAPASLPDDDVARLLSQKYQLTQREVEVALLLAKGNTQKKISDSLYVAPGTVQSHVKAIYRKLGVHSKQEIIDLVNNALP